MRAELPSPTCVPSLAAAAGRVAIIAHSPAHGPHQPFVAEGVSHPFGPRAKKKNSASMSVQVLLWHVFIATVVMICSEGAHDSFIVFACMRRLNAIANGKNLAALFDSVSLALSAPTPCGGW
jgi:hypothetical protein